MSNSLKVKRRRCFVGLLCGACLLISSALVVSAQDSTEPVLELAKPIERTLAGEQLHKYTITVGAEQYMRLVASQNGVDIMMTVLDPAGRKLVNAYDNAGGGIETIALISSEAGNYTLEVRPVQKTAPSGKYTIEITDLRGPTDKDRVDSGAETLFRDGTTAFEKGTAAGLDEAVEKLTAASVKYRQAGNRRGEAQALDLLGQTYNRIGDKHKFRAAREQALPIWRDLKDRRQEALALNAIGTFHLMDGNNPTAIDYFNQAIAIYQQIGERLSAATAMNNIAVIHYGLAEYQSAFNYYHQVLAIFRELGSKNLQPVVLRNIGNVFYTWGDWHAALDYYRQSLDLVRELKDKRGEATTLEFIGRGHFILGDVPKSIESLERSLQLHTEVGNQVGQADALTNLGLIHYRIAQQQKALELLNQAMSMWEKLNNRPGIAITNFHLGMAHYANNDLTKALEAFNKALELNRATEHKFYIADSLRMIATIERDRGQYEAAITHAAPAVEMIERIRQRITLPAMRASYFSTMQEVFDVYLDALLQADKQSPGKYAATALQVVERARARTLIDTLIESNANIKAGVDSELIKQEKTLISRISTQATALTRLLSGKHTEEQKAEATKQLEALQKQYESVQAQIRDRSPAYAALTQPTPLSVAEIQQQLLDADTMLLEYALGRKRSYLFAVTRDSVKTFELPPREQIEQSARRVYEAITTRNKRVKFETVDERRLRVDQAEKDYSTAAAALSKMVIGPLADQLKAKRLLVVADGALQYIPFGALPETTNASAQNLITRHEIVMLPSASTLSVLRRGIADRPTAPKLISVLADPVFEANDERLLVAKKKHGTGASMVPVSATRSAEEPAWSYLKRSSQDLGDDGEGLSLTRLPFTRDEANAIAKMVGVSERNVQLDFAANRQAATNPELSQYRFVHFATHGILNSTHPNLSGLAFSLVNEDGKPQDGFLRASEIFNLKLSADLVVLSACRTGLGKEIRGEGVIGLTRAFMYAGAARVMVSLWDINDEGTAELMKRFYGNLLGRTKMSPAAALRLAQVSMAADKRWSSPYYWAGFTLQGEPR
jgi:CHAT domain-containing protein